MRRKGFVKKDNRIRMPNGNQGRAYTGIRMKDAYTTKDMAEKPQEQIRQEVWTD